MAIFRGFQRFADFADQDDVGVLPQEKREAAAAKFQPDSVSFICTWLTPAN